MSTTTFEVPTSSQPPASDLSGQLMEALFGNNWWDMQAGTDGLAPLLYHMLGSINMICLTFIGAYLSYIVIVEVLGTGSEGKVGGKHDIMWTPLRMGYSIFMSAPVTTVGANIGQVVLMFAVGLSINAANAIWGTALDYFQESGMSTIVAEPPPTLRQEIHEASKAMFAVQIVQAYADRKFQADAIGCKYEFVPKEEGLWDNISSALGFEGAQTGEPGTHILRFTLPSQTALSPTTLGSISIEGVKNDQIQLARMSGLEAAYKVILPYSAQVADKVQPDPGFLHAAENAYEREVAPVLSKVGEIYSETEVIKNVNEFVEEARTLGWITAGAYTMKMARLQEKVNDELFETPEIVYPDYEEISSRLSDPMYNGLVDAMRIGQRALKLETCGDFEGSQKLGTDDDTTWYSDLWDFFRARMLYDYLASKLANNDPMLVLANFGSNLLDATFVACGVGVAASSAGGLAEGVGDAVGSIPVVGGIAKGIGKAASKTIDFFMPFLVMAIVALFFAAVTLAYGLPLIPFFYWIYGIVDWLLLIIESLVAMPFWMIGHAISRQHGFAGEKGGDGYMLVLEVMIRPSLNVVGLCFAYAAMSAVGMVFGKLIILATDSSFVGMFGLGGAGATGLITNLALSFMICLVFWKVSHMFFTRGVSHLPKTVTKWLGGRGSMTDAEQEAQSTGNMFIAGLRQSTPQNLNMGKSKKVKPVGEAATDKGSGDHTPGQTQEPKGDGGV